MKGKTLDLNDISATQEEALRSVVAVGDGTDWRGLPGIRVSRSNAGHSIHWKTAQALERAGLVTVQSVQYTESETRVLPTAQAKALLEKGSTA